MSHEIRVRKLADRIVEIVAVSLRTKVKDPRVRSVTITDARVTGDLREATVFYSVFGDEAAREEAAVALQKVRGLMRSEVGRLTGIKHTPTITFILDAVPDNARKIDELLRRAQAADAEVAAAATGATYAGDADPYVTADTHEDDGVDVDDERADGTR